MLLNLLEMPFQELSVIKSAFPNLRNLVYSAPMSELGAKIIVLIGPTASGKSSLAVALAIKIGGEIISADSRQVYRGLDIGSGKIQKSEMKGVRHHLLDIASPKRVYSASDFVRDGRTAIADIQKRGKIPIICGGTGFYIDVLLGRISLPQVDADPILRAALENKSVTQLFTLLKKKDPVRAVQMDTSSERNNKVRLIRALEVAVSNKKHSKIPSIPGEVQWLGISYAQKKLDTRIIKRLKSRLKSGMVAEAQRLHVAGLSYKRMESLGLEYRSLSRFLRCIITQAELESELLHDIRAYSKRQITYWRRNQHITWLPAPVTASQAIQHLV